MDLCRPEDGPDLDEEIERLAKDFGWESILLEVYSLLTDIESKENWYDSACIIWWTATDGIQNPFNNTEVVARLYWCLSKMDGLGFGEMGNNLVWSATIELMEISYMSDWQPLEQPEIMNKINVFNQQHS